MINLKTSTKISIKFTIFTIIIVIFFGILVNIIFFEKWHTPLTRTISNITTMNNKPTMIHKGIFRDHFKNNLTIDINSAEYKLLKESPMMGGIYIIDNIACIDNKYFYFEEIGKKVIVLDITQQIRSQKDLILITLYLLIFFGVLSYIISLYFVKSSLNKLNHLVEYMKKLDVDNLNNKLEIIGPQDDEINILAIKINTALDKIHKQTLSLKDFISNASNELKTPLMTINSEIDYALKSKNHKKGLENIKAEINYFNDLLNELVLITKIDSNINLEKKDINIARIVEKNLKNIAKNYSHKKIQIIKNIDNIKQKTHNSSFDIISKNLIENAFKYTDNGIIDIKLNNNEFMIKDTGVGIEKKNLKKIWDRFWQEDSSKTETGSFGLGLYLTKLLVEKHGRKIKANSQKGKGTEFKIIF